MGWATREKSEKNQPRPSAFVRRIPAVVAVQGFLIPVMDFRRLVLGCIDASDGESGLISQHSSRSVYTNDSLKLRDSIDFRIFRMIFCNIFRGFLKLCDVQKLKLSISK